jgi:hypothetical protein
LYYQIILFSPTDNTNLNLTLKTTKKPCSLQIKFALAKISKKTSLNKLKRNQKRHNRCLSPNVPKGTQINNIITLKPNNSPNQTSISGSNEFTIEDFGQPWEVTQQTSVPHGITPAGAKPFTEGTNSTGIKLGELIQATGQPWEVTQQTSVPHGTTPADQQLTEGNNSNGIKLGELTSNSQEIISTIQATGQPWEVTQQTSVPRRTTPADQQLTEGNNSNGIKLSELTSNSQEIISTIQATGQPCEVTQQTFAQHGQVSADDQRLNEGNTSTGIKNLLHEFNPAVMIPAGNPTQIYPKPTGNYPQQILKQAYGSSKNFLHEFNPAVMIAAVTPPPIHPKPIQNYQQQILTQSYGTNNHASPAPNRCPTRFSVIPTERPKAVGVPKTRKYSDTNTTHKATMEPGNTVHLPKRYSY